MDNQNTPQNITPEGAPSQMPPSVTESKPVGALIGSIIIVIILIIGGFYLWTTKIAPAPEPMMENGMPIMNGTAQEMTAQEQALSQPDPVVSQMATVATSDEVTAIDADLKTTKLDGMDSELQAQ